MGFGYGLGSIYYFSTLNAAFQACVYLRNEDLDIRSQKYSCNQVIAYNIHYFFPFLFVFIIICSFLCVYLRCVQGELEARPP